MWFECTGNIIKMDRKTEPLNIKCIHAINKSENRNIIKGTLRVISYNYQQSVVINWLIKTHLLYLAKAHPIHAQSQMSENDLQSDLSSFEKRN